MLEHGSLLSMALPLLDIGFPAGSFHLEQVRDEGSLAILGELAKEYFAAPVTLRVTAIAASQEKVPPSLAVARQTEEADRRRQLEGDARAHPAVQAVLEVFGGEVHEVRPIDKVVKAVESE
jgi:DNA polymerase III subunit gamma/tau